MSSTLTIYIDPSTAYGEFHWEGPDLYRFEDSIASDIVTGYDDFGAALHEEVLTPQESDMLEPKGHINEHERLTLFDPQALRAALLKFYDMFAQRVLIEEIVVRKRESGLDSYWVFSKTRRQIGGAVLICDRAIEQGRKVYVALW